jgi:hypothetical protein
VQVAACRKKLNWIVAQSSHTSKIHLGRMIFEWFLAKYPIWLCTGFSVAQNGHFL